MPLQQRIQPRKGRLGQRRQVRTDEQSSAVAREESKHARHSSPERAPSLIDKLSIKPALERTKISRLSDAKLRGPRDHQSRGPYLRGLREGVDYECIGQRGCILWWKVGEQTRFGPARKWLAAKDDQRRAPGHWTVLGLITLIGRNSIFLMISVTEVIGIGVTLGSLTEP